MKRLCSILVFLVVSLPACAQIQGLGYGTLTCVDRDNDGYGVGPGCLGLDADDLDSSVHTAAQGTSKYGTLAAFIAHLGTEPAQDSAGLDPAGIAAGYGSPNHTWYLAPAGSGGSDSNNCASVVAPCLTISRLVTEGFVGGDLVIARQAWNGVVNLFNGTASKYTVFMSYPGEQAIITGGAGNNVNLPDASYVVIDGLNVQNFSGISGGTTNGAGVNRFNHVLIRHVDGGAGGERNGAVAIFNGLSYFVVEDSVFHDDSCGGGACQHGMYNGSDELPSDHVVYRRLIAYGNDYNGLTFNGRCTSCTFSQLITYNNLVSGLTFEMGVSNSTIGPVLSFNNGKQINFFDYAGQGFIDAGNGSATVSVDGAGHVTWLSSADGCTFTTCADPVATGISINCQWFSVQAVTDAHHLVLNQAGPAAGTYVYYQAPPICPYDETGNLVENVTLYSTQHFRDGTDNTTGSAFQISNVNPGAGQNLGGNTYRNVIAVDWGSNNHYSPFQYTDCNTTGDGTSCGSDGALCASVCQGWLLHDTFDHVVHFQTDGNNGNGLIAACTSPTCNSFGFASYTCAQAHSTFGTTASSCTNANPKFMQADPSYWNAINLFNFRLQSTSPALNVGTTTGIPPFDLYGVPFMSSPSMGAIEARTLLANGWTDTGTAITTSVCPANGFNGSVGDQGQSNPYPYQSNCHNVYDAWNGGFQITGSSYQHKACNFGGGHSDYVGNEIYCTTFSLASPSTVRLNSATSPDTYTVADWGNCPESLPDTSPANPNSRHIANGEKYIPWINKMMIVSGAVGCGNGPHYYYTWLYDFSTLTWANQEPMNCDDHGSGFTTCGQYNAVGRQLDPVNAPPPGYSTSEFEHKVLSDTATQTVMVIGWDTNGQELLQYYPQYNQYIVRHAYGTGEPIPPNPSGFGGPVDTDLLIDNGTSRFILEWGHGTAIKIDITNLASVITPSSPSVTYSTITSNIDSSCSTLLNALAPMLAYDTNTGKIVGKPGDSAQSYVMDISSTPWTCTTGPGGGPTYAITGTAGGAPYNRLGYDANLDAFIADSGFAVDYEILSLNARGSASTIRKINGDGQSADVSTELPVLLSVQVVDSNGVPIPNTTVAWAVTAGSGSLSATSVTTDQYGTASSSLTLGPWNGTNTVTATSAGLTGSPVTFNATGGGAGNSFSGLTQGSSVLHGSVVIH